MALDIVSREGWRAIPPLQKLEPSSKISIVYSTNFHKYTCNKRDVCSSAMRWTQKFHTWFQQTADIRYNFMIAGDGLIYEGRGWGMQPLLPYKFSPNKQHSLFVAWLGPFDEIGGVPQEMLQLRDRLLVYGVTQGHIAEDFMLYDLKRTHMPKITVTSSNSYYD